MDDKAIWQLEETFWRGESEFYDRHLTQDALMVFPAPVGVMGRDKILESIQQGGRWINVKLTDQRLTRPNEQTAVLVYSAQADRGTPQTQYKAQCSSTYTSDKGIWRLSVHQQTPSWCSFEKNHT